MTQKVGRAISDHSLEVGAIPEDWTGRAQEWALSSGVRIVAIIAGAFLFYWLTLLVSRKLLHVARRMGDNYVSREQEVRARTLAGIIRSALLAVIIVVVALIILKELGYDIGPLIAGAGIAGLAIGFGAQTLVKDMIGGFFILLEGQFYVGDVVQVGAVSGKVEAIRLRTTLVRDGEGVLHIIPNGEMRVVANMTRGWSKAVVDVQVDYREDLDRVMGLLKEAGAKVAAPGSPVADCVTEGPDVLGVEQLEAGTVTIRLVARTKPFKDAEVARELRKEVAACLGSNEIAVSGAASA